MRTVETRIHVAATPDAALNAFLELEAMRKWWHVDRGLVDPREGGVWAFAWERSEHGFKYVITGRIASLQPGHRRAPAPIQSSATVPSAFPNHHSRKYAGPLR